MFVVGNIMSDHEIDQPPTLHYTTLCPVVSVVVEVQSQLQNMSKRTNVWPVTYKSSDRV